ncbi:hypothetical protein [Pseudopedobacter sp.]|uniref:hypothetical protein n=1 Tax=Pseudopedobacter sp. TaxID=1936787 RepID=UPI0033419ADE
MADISINKAPQGYVVIPFFITAAFFFLAFSVLLLTTGSQIWGHYFQPKVLAIVHTLALGWGTMIIFGAAYQLVPVIFERSLSHPKLAFLSYLFLTSGTCLLIHCFWNFNIGWMMIMAGSFITLSSYLYFYIVWMTTKDSVHSFELNLYFMLSAFWFCFTTTVGLLLAINLAYPYIEKNHLDILKLHAHIGIVGWFMQLIFGAGAKMIPMFLLGKSKKRKLLYSSIILINLGLLLFLADGYKNQVSMRSLVFGGMIFSGSVCWLIYIMDCFQSRARKHVDIAMRHVLISIVCLLLAFVNLPWVINQEAGNWVSLYVVWIFLGWITGIILGMTFKTLPFIIWNIRYKDLNGSPHFPMPKDLYSQRLLQMQYYTFILSILFTAIALAFKSHVLFEIVTWFWVVLSVVYMLNVGKIIKHMRRT